VNYYLSLGVQQSDIKMNPANLKLFLWALPLFMCIHVFEEFAFPGGFIRWMASQNSKRLHKTYYYVAINGIGIFLGAITALTATNVVGYCLFIWLVTYMATNGLSHAIASVQARRYCPGTVTGIFLFVPLLLVSYWVFATQDLVNWQSLVLNAISAFVVGYFFITVHQNKRLATGKQVKKE